MKKKLLSLDDLYAFYVSQGKSCNFQAEDEDSCIVVHYDADLKINDNELDQETQFGIHLRACHTLENRNGSCITEDSMKEAIPSIYNKPILANIHQLEDGTYDFGGHDFDLDDNGDLIYIEIPVGTIPETCNPQLIYDKEADKTYLEVDGILYENYTKAPEILRDKKETKVSVEIAVDSLSYDNDNKLLIIDKFRFMGVTLLGKRNDGTVIEEGMAGSKATFSDFSKKNNSCYSEEKLIEVLDKLNNTLSDLSINNNYGKEVIAVDKDNLFEEVSESTEDDVVVETESMESTENTESEVVNEETFNEEIEETIEEVSEEFVKDEDEKSDEEEVSDEEDSEEEDEENPEEEETEEESCKKKEYNEVNYSISYGEREINFSRSLISTIECLHKLVNEQYENDNTYYDVDVFDGEKDVDKYVIMHDMYTGNNYKQYYKVKNNVYTLSGDRVAVYCRYLTEDEISRLDNMSKRYSEMETELNAYHDAEMHEKRMNVLNNEDYSVLNGTAEFSALKNEMDNYSVEELSVKADLLYAKHMKKNSQTFSSFVTLGSKKNVDNKDLPYGGIFANFKS